MKREIATAIYTQLGQRHKTNIYVFYALGGLYLLKCLLLITWTAYYRKIKYYSKNTHRGGSRKKNIGGRGLAPHHLGGNNEQNYCVQLSSIKQLMHRNYPENWGELGKIWWGAVPPGPNLEPPLHTQLLNCRKLYSNKIH